MKGLNVAYASKTFDYLLGVDDETKCPSKVTTFFLKLGKQ